jgi:hypothetical protein
MANALHIVNGDSTAAILKQTNIIGDIVVWREMLCEGPICKLIGSDDFWKLRYSYFETEIGISKLEYYDKTIKEIVKLEDISKYNEVVLWFEFDLFCQINLMGLCTYLLNSYRKDITYNLICSGNEKGDEKLRSLADFSIEGFQEFYCNKVKITRHDLLFAQQCWHVFVENNFEKLLKFNFNKSSKFKYFQLAINQHLKRLPLKSGLNEIQHKILELIHREVLTKNELIHKLLIWQHKETVYGFSDLQYLINLKKLEKYYTVVNLTYYLNEEGILKINQ